MIPNTATRVAEHTSPSVNERIRRDMENRVSALRGSGKSATLEMRLKQLDQEWDVERVLQTNFAVLSLVGLALATKVNRRWFALALGVPAFMVQHALQGWCPPLAVLRRLGFRTAREISDERFMLKSLRGDFESLPESKQVDEVLHAVSA